jgi:hypothetical protein
LLAEEEEGDGWRGAGDGELWPPDALLDSLRVLAKENIRESAEERGRVWEREECADSPVVARFELKRSQVPASSGERLRRLGGVIQRKWRGKM